MVASTKYRVSDNTAQKINRRIQREMRDRVASCTQQGPEAIESRLRELDEEWDIERAIEAMASTFTLASLLLGLTVNRRFLIFPVAVAGFLLQHAVQGWCPPIPVLRRIGFRTADEISHERYALKLLRGDFGAVPPAATGPSHASPNDAILAAAP
jgi:hypothetical protein